MNANSVISTDAEKASLIVKVNVNGVVRVTFNRPEKGNAYTGEMLDRLEESLDWIAADGGARVLVLTGSGAHFQAGADLNWVRQVSEGDSDTVRKVSEKTTRVLHRLNSLTLPTVALINGACFGGGVGIAACCDTVIASTDAKFAISEVLFGQAPLPIVPQLNATIGHRNSRRYALTGERFTSLTAQEIGLVHEVVPADRLESRGEEIVTAYLRASPSAIARTKKAFLEWEAAGRGEAQFIDLSRGAAEQRLSKESAEGLRAFLERRDPAWFQ